MNADPTAAERPLTCPVHFDYRDDPGLLSDPWERWTQMRTQARFPYEEFGGYKIWLISDYDDVRDAFQRYELFSSKTLSPYEPVKDPEKRIIPAEIDPPEHGGLPADDPLLPLAGPRRSVGTPPCAHGRKSSSADSPMTANATS